MADYIRRDIVLKIINTVNDTGGFAGYADYCTLFDEIDTMPASNVQPISQWISVKDRLPDKSCECLGIVDGEVTEVSYSPKQKGLICGWSMCDADGFKPLSDDAVTHWMPLPEPPKGGDTK